MQNIDFWINTAHWQNDEMKNFFKLICSLLSRLLCKFNFPADPYQYKFSSNRNRSDHEPQMLKIWKSGEHETAAKRIREDAVKRRC